MQLYHQRSGEKKGCGFVMFEDKDSVAKAARNELHIWWYSCITSRTLPNWEKYSVMSSSVVSSPIPPPSTR